MPGSCPRNGTWGAGRANGVNIFFEHGHVAYQIDEKAERNRIQVKFLH